MWTKKASHCIKKEGTKKKYLRNSSSSSLFLPFLTLWSIPYAHQCRFQTNTNKIFIHLPLSFSQHCIEFSTLLEQILWMYLCIFTSFICVSFQKINTKYSTEKTEPKKKVNWKPRSPIRIVVHTTQTRAKNNFFIYFF